MAPMSASAVTINLSQSGSWTGSAGYISQTQNFLLPTNAVNVALTITNFDVDDRGILSLNGAAVDATGIFASNGSVGSFNFGQNAPTVSYTYNASGVRNRVVTTGFILGASNSFNFQGNDTNNGIFGTVLTTAANAGFTYTANVTYDLAAGVPEPATWAMMMIGFGGMGFVLRRRRQVSTRVRFA